eukprot:Plantae.Rhodophyta-Rhodochaete_pulchella.ctg18951.p1 GENE.Plantae.Rhodophyta-Rhodochaete_pulchella.ctg18951~~Plantae.Rhodophyta-Rhodochaete_pulchella.ctg18951.p1  ORF type:complete len:334 (+),score=41.93 Plantae.Rhodophyta-Rhodochaete_pulchella.ctg18951:35-1003(+)
MANEATEDEAAALLSCRLDSARSLVEALSCIASSSKRDRDVVLTAATRGGLRLTTEEAGCMQASVLIRAEAFASFSARQDLALSVNLSVLLDALQLFVSSDSSGRSSSTHGLSAVEPIRILCQDSAQPLVLASSASLNEDGIDQGFSVTCRIRMLSEPSVADFAFASVPVVNSVIVQSDVLREALGDLDYAGAAVCELRLGPQPPRFRLESGDPNTGSSLAVELPDPDDPGTQVYREFSSKKLQVCCYRLSLLQRCLKALASSDTTKVRMNADGMLSLAIKMKSFAASGSGFVEFTIVAEEIEDDDDFSGTGDGNAGLGNTN